MIAVLRRLFTGADSPKDPAPKRQAQRPTCQLCGAPAKFASQHEPWPGYTYAHQSFTCMEHRTYLEGHGWSKSGDGPWIDGGKPQSSCSDCRGTYGACGCPRQGIAQQAIAWEKRTRIWELP